MICFTLVFHSPVPLSVNETPVKQNIFSQSLQVLFYERLLLFGFKKVENPIMSEFSDSDSDRVKTCQNTSTRVDTQLPPSSSYLNCDSRAKDFEFQRWSELLERARAAEVCMGCDFVNVTNESPKCYTDMASTAQLLYGDILEVTAVTVLTTGTVSSWRLTTSHLRAAWLSQTDDDHVLRAVYSLSTTGPTISARFEISSERQTSSATQASCLMSPHPRGVLCVAQAVEKEDYSRRSRFGTCVSMPRQSVRLRHPISHKLVRRPSLIGAELQHLRLSGKL